LNDSDVRIAIDAMGGDLAPDEVVAGACGAAKALGFQLLLVGDERRIAPLVSAAGGAANIRVVHAAEEVAMHEAPSAALRRGGQTSMGKVIELVRDGDADAAFSAGNSGAFLAIATIRLRTVPGIARSAFATAWPARRGPMLLLDSGANVDCKPEWLVQFAVMGTAYARGVLGVAAPKVGLLSVGEEEGKGDALTAAAFALLKSAPIDFIGNVEGRDLLLGDADVIVCDGFVGNVALKLVEATSEYIFDCVRSASRETLRARAGALMMRPALRRVKAMLDYREYGGAPLLGVRGVCLIGHGRADSIAVQSACRAALAAVRHGVVDAIATAMGGAT
jgi:glycerol-3-phosphate acyltransferase PlsX